MSRWCPHYRDRWTTTRAPCPLPADLDLTAFADVALANPGRVRAVFIRKVGEAMSPDELTAKANLEAANVPLWLGTDYAAGHSFLASVGLLSDEDAKALVETVEGTDPARKS